MINQKYVLVSNRELPSNKIGSWTTRFSNFIKKNPVFFDYILSPKNDKNDTTYCKKRNFLTWNRKLRNIVLILWVAIDYINKIHKISKNADKLIVVVVDDTHLLEAITLKKDQFSCPIEIVFSFHGFNLDISSEILDKTDKVLFLTELSYLNSIKLKKSFTPEAKIVGNGVDSNIFYPLNNIEKENQKKEFGFEPDDKIICWMANNRRVKGLHIFIKIIDKINTLDLPIKFLIIGSIQKIHKENVINLGKLSNPNLAKYLQISDFYFFISLCQEGFGLSLVEAIKTGNSIITSSFGGIPEVIEGLHNITVVKKPNIVSEWINAFVKFFNAEHRIISIEETSKIWSYKDWEEKFKNAIK